MAYFHTYYLGTKTRTLSCDIAITDGGGGHTVFGSALFGPCAVRYTARFTQSGGNRSCSLTLVATSGTSGTSTTATITNPSAPITGTITLEVDTREYLTIGTTTGPAIGTSFESQYGDATATISLMGQSATYTQASNTARVSPSWTIRAEAWVTSGDGGDGETSITVTTAPDSATSSATSSSVSRSGTRPTGLGFDYTYAYASTATATSVSAASARTAFAGSTSADAYGLATISADRTATLHGRLQRMLEAWPTSINYRTTETGSWVSSSDGDFSASISQKSYRTECDCLDPAGSSNASDIHTASERVNIAPSVQTLGGLRIYGPRWDAISVGYTSSRTVDDGTSLTPAGTWGGTWSASAGASISTSGGAIVLTGPDGKSMSRTITASGHYSRLRIRLKASAAAHSITVRLGSDTTTSGITYKAKSWGVSTGAAGTATNLYIDLGAETSGPDYSVWDFGNQIATSEPGGSYAAAYFGGIGALTLENLGAGSYEVEEIELLNAPNGSGGHNAPLIHLFNDKMISQVDGLLGFAYDVNRDPAALSDLVTTINGAMGYTATDLTPGTATGTVWPISELTTTRHFGIAIGGYGLLFAMSGTSPAWSLPFDSGAFGIGALPAQWTIDQFSWDWSDADAGGFVFSDGAGGIALGAGLSLAASVWGRVLQPSDTQTAGDDTAPAGRDPASGVAVTLKDLSGATLSTATTGSNGTFSFGVSATTEGSARLYVDGVEGFVEVPVSAQRSRGVVVITNPNEGQILGMATSASGRVVRAWRDEDDLAVLEFWTRSAWQGTTTSISAAGLGALAYDTGSAAQRLYMALEDSGGIKSRYTEDEGSTWSMAVTIVSSGTYPAMCVSPTGATHYFWIDGTAIKTKILDSVGNTLTSTTTAVASGVDASPLACTHDGELLHLTYRNSSNAVITVESADGGLTFS